MNVAPLPAHVEEKVPFDQLPERLQKCHTPVAQTEWPAGEVFIEHKSPDGRVALEYRGQVYRMGKMVDQRYMLNVGRLGKEGEFVDPLGQSVYGLIQKNKELRAAATDSAQIEQAAVAHAAKLQGELDAMRKSFDDEKAERAKFQKQAMLLQNQLDDAAEKREAGGMKAKK